VNTTQQVGGALGLAVLATISASHTSSLLHAGHSTPSALTSGYHLAWVIGTGLLVAALATALVVLRPAPAPAVVEDAPYEVEELAAYADAA
jgi:hypothetical protein